MQEHQSKSSMWVLTWDLNANRDIDYTLCEMCPSTELFLVRIIRISPYSVRMWENTDQKKLRIWTLFTQ